MIYSYNYLVIHHSASPRDSTKFEDVWHWHVVDNRWDDIGYHFLIEGDGAICPGRRLPTIGAHAPPHNQDSIGICVVGNNLDEAQKWNDLQIDSLAQLVRAARLLFPGIEVVGHRDVGSTPTQCPGTEVGELLL